MTGLVAEFGDKYETLKGPSSLVNYTVSADFVDI